MSCHRTEYRRVFIDAPPSNKEKRRKTETVSGLYSHVALGESR